MSKTNEGKACDAVIRRPRAAGSRRRGERYWNTDFGSWRRTAALRELATVCQLAVVSLAFGTVVIAGGRELVGAHGAFHLGVVAVAREHQVGDAAKVDLGYHSGGRLNEAGP
jgi:hypothetical protein